MAQGTAQDAVVQIKEKGYVTTFATDDRPILLVDVCLDEKTRNIGEWKEEIANR